MKQNNLSEQEIACLTNLDDTVAGKVDMKSFSFVKSREILKDYEGSFADAVIEERRSQSGGKNLHGHGLGPVKENVNGGKK